MAIEIKMLLKANGYMKILEKITDEWAGTNAVNCGYTKRLQTQLQMQFLSNVCNKTYQ